MFDLESVVPDPSERQELRRALKALGLEFVELAHASDRSEIYFFVAVEDLDRIGTERANLALSSALPGRKTLIAIKPRNIPTSLVDLNMNDPE